MYVPFLTYASKKSLSTKASKGRIASE